MADTNSSPNMGMPVPIPGTTPGAAWATDIVASLSVVDSHTHGPGQGVQITPDALNISADLSFGSNNAYSIRSVRLISQGTPISGGDDLDCVYVSGVDLYYNDGDGTQIRLTQGGAVAGSPGTITGLPSGTASAAYAGGTFSFLSATSTPAIMSVGPVKISRNVVNPKFVTISGDAGQAADYAMTLPAALPGLASFLYLNPSGSISYNAASFTGTGAVVQATSAVMVTPSITGPTIVNGTIISSTYTGTFVGGNFTGMATGNITSGSYTPTYSVVTGSGVTSVANSFFYTRINDRVTVFGQINATSDVSGLISITITVPLAPTSNFAAQANATGLVTINGGSSQASFIRAQTGAKTVLLVVTGLSASIAEVLYVTFTYSCA